MHEFRLVDIGEGLTEAEVVSWLVAVGDHVVEDQPVVEIETDKAVVEMPAPVTGTVISLGGDVGAVIAVGEVLVIIDDGSARRPRRPAAGRPLRHRLAHRPLATPSTRALARELGVDLATISGSGPGGRIVDADVTLPARRPPLPLPPAAAERRAAIASPRRRARASTCAACASALPRT